VGDAYGFGARTSALAGAGVAGAFAGYGAWNNPAALSLSSDKRLLISWGIVDMMPKFKDINGVVLENSYMSDKTTPVTGDVNNDYRDTFGQQIGFNYQLFPEFHRLSIGVSLFLPLAQAAYASTGRTFQPEFILYRSRTLRPHIELGTALQLSERFHFGVGLHLVYSTTTNTQVFLTSTTSHSSDIYLEVSVKPKAAPYFGWLYVSDPALSKAVGTDMGPAGTYSLGLVVRTPGNATHEISATSAAQLLGAGGSVPITFNALSSLYYDPWSFELGSTYQYAPNSRIYLEADYQLWSKFEAATFTSDPALGNCTISGCGSDIASIKRPDYRYRDIVIPKIGHEVVFGKTTFRAGYAFRPGIIRGLPQDAGNALDPSKHIFSVGAGFQFDKFLNFDVPCNVDAYFAWHQLITQTVTKTPGDEQGDTSSQKVGAPGYEAGGKILGGGVSLTLAF
jgi:hypothetical protein